MKRVKVDPLTGEDMVDPVTGEDQYEDDGVEGGPAGGMGAGHEAEGAFGERDPQEAKANIFPSAKDAPLSADRTGQNPATGQSYGPPSGSAVLPAADDLYNVPTRALATTRGMEMSDPGAYLFRPEVNQQEKSPAPYANPYANQNFAGTSEMAGRTASDPLSALLFGFSKLGKAGMAALEQAAPGISKAAEALHRWNGRSAEKLSGVPLEALEANRDPAKRAMMKENFGQEAEIGAEFLDKLNNYDDYLPEAQGIDKALEKMPPISTAGAVNAMQAAKQKPVAGVYSPIDQAGNAKAEPWIDFIRGGPEPEDLSRSASQAARDLEQAAIAAKTTGVRAKVDTRDAERALRAQEKAQREAGRAAAGVGGAKRDAEGVLHSWDQLDAASAIESSLKQAKEAAGKAREAAIDARAKLAVGGISKADYAAAKAEEASAARKLDVVSSAQKIFNGQNQKEVARDLSRAGMKAQDIRDVLSKARDRAQSIPALETTIPAKAYREKRKRLDANINFEDKADDIVNRIQKAGRSEMMVTMERVAEESGNPEFRDLMKSYSKKVQLVDDLKAYIGQTKGANRRKIQQFFDHLLGKNSQNKQDVVAAMDRIMGTNTLERARSAQQAQQIGHNGEAAWFPMHNNGAMGAGQQWLGRIGFLWSSPAIASRATLPAFAKIEALAKKVGSAIPPRANKLVMAIEKSESPTKAAPLVNQLIQLLEMEAQMPSNTVPFRKVAENEDNTRYSRK